MSSQREYNCWHNMWKCCYSMSPYFVNHPTIVCVCVCLCVLSFTLFKTVSLWFLHCMCQASWHFYMKGSLSLTHGNQDTLCSIVTDHIKKKCVLKQQCNFFFGQKCYFYAKYKLYTQRDILSNKSGNHWEHFMAWLDDIRNWPRELHTSRMDFALGPCPHPPTPIQGAFFQTFLFLWSYFGSLILRWYCWLLFPERTFIYVWSSVQACVLSWGRLLDPDWDTMLSHTRSADTVIPSIISVMLLKG